MDGVQVSRMGGSPTARTQDLFAALMQRCSVPSPRAAPLEPVVVGGHDLNISRTYASWLDGFSWTRELVQNWYDRALELLEGQPTGLTDTGWVDGARLAFHERGRQGSVDFGPPQPLCGGYILEQVRR